MLIRFSKTPWASVGVFSLSIAAQQGCSGRVIPSGDWTASSAGSNSSVQSGVPEAGHALGGRAAGGTTSSSGLAGRAGEPSAAGDGGRLADGGATGDADENRGGAGIGGVADGADPSSGGLAGIGAQNGGTAGAIGSTGGGAIGGTGGDAIGGTGGDAIGGAGTGGQGGSAGSAGSNPWCSLGRYCRSDNLYACDSNGVEVLYFPCSLAGGYCVDLDNQCSPQVCRPNQPACNGSFATTCNANGSGTLSGGTDCSATQQTCGQNGACATKVCEPNHGFCSDNTVYQCDAWGTSSYAAQTCGSGKHCFNRGDRADCAIDACSPGKAGCAGESFGQCGADGNSVANASVCSASSQVCTEQGCASSSVNTIDPTPRAADWGSSGTYGNSRLFGNAFDASNARTLTAIEIYLRLDFAYDLHWQIYELDGLTGEPNPEPKWILRYQVTTNDSGTGFHSSGPLSFPLLAGHTYLLGVEVLAFGPNTSIWFTYEHGPNVPQTLPFARTAGMVVVSAASKVGDTVSAMTFGGDQLLYQRLTTSAP